MSSKVQLSEISQQRQPQIQQIKRSRHDSSSTNSSAQNSPPSKMSTLQLTPALNAALDNHSAQISALQASVTNIERAVLSVKNDVDALKEEQEFTRKQMLSKALIVYGIEESEYVTASDTETKVTNMTNRLGLANLDYNNISRHGRPKTGVIRPIELTLLRLRDKIALLKAKNQMRSIYDYKRVYINNARTQKEMKIRKLLKAHGRVLLTQAAYGKFRIRNNVLQFTVENYSNYFKVTKEGIVTVIRTLIS